MKASADLLLFLVKRLAKARGEARDRAPKKRREQTAQKETGIIFAEMRSAVYQPFHSAVYQPPSQH